VFLVHNMFTPAECAAVAAIHDATMAARLDPPRWCFEAGDLDFYKGNGTLEEEDIQTGNCLLQSTVRRKMPWRSSSTSSLHSRDTSTLIDNLEARVASKLSLRVFHAFHTQLVA
jgi:hypothetical protein